MNLMRRFRQAQIDRRYPWPGRWTVGELRRQVDRKCRDLQPLRDGQTPSPLAAVILQEAEVLSDELHRLNGQEDAPIQFVERWIRLRPCTIKGSRI